MPPFDDNTARARPAFRGTEPAPRDEYSYPEGTAKRCPYPDDSVPHENVRHIRSARVARSAHRRVSPWTGTPPSLTSPSVPNRHSSSGYAQAAPAVRPDLMRRSLGRTGCTSCRDHAGDSGSPKARRIPPWSTNAPISRRARGCGRPGLRLPRRPLPCRSA